MKLKIFLTFASFMVFNPVFAGDFNECTAYEILSSGDANVHVRLSCSVVNAPPCASALNYFGFDATTIEGKRYFAMVSMALTLKLKLSGRVSDFICAPQGNVALLTSLQIKE